MQSKLLKSLVYFASFITISIVIIIIAYVIISGIKPIFNEIIKLSNGDPSLFDIKYTSENVSIIPAFVNTIILTFLSILLSGFLGIFTSIYLVEYSNTDSFVLKMIRIATETLAGIPSIIYGLFGSLFFVIFLGLGMSLIAGILTISIMVLPLIIRSTEEALKSVPKEYREASFALGAGRLRTIFIVVLPSAVKGILAGIILAIGRIVGETACLLYTAGTSPNMGDLSSTGRTLSVHMYMLSSEGLYIEQAYATSAILLVIVLGLNTISSQVAKKMVKQ